MEYSSEGLQLSSIHMFEQLLTLFAGSMEVDRFEQVIHCERMFNKRLCLLL